MVPLYACPKIVIGPLRPWSTVVISAAVSEEVTSGFPASGGYGPLPKPVAWWQAEHFAAKIA